MTPAEQSAALQAWLDDHPTPPTRPLTNNEWDAADYWESVAEDRKAAAHAPMSPSDETRRENAYEHWLDQLGGSR